MGTVEYTLPEMGIVELSTVDKIRVEYIRVQ